MFNILEKLCTATGVSGNEKDVCQVAYNMLFPYSDVEISNTGNVVATFGNKDAEKTILIDAHIDQIGFIVTEITHKGFLKIEKCGGIDFRTVQGCGVVIHGTKEINGVVCCLPPHLSDGKEDKAISSDKVYVDTGLDYDEVLSIVSIGDSVTFVEKPTMLINNRVTSPALDNRASVASVIKLAQLLKGKDCPFKVVAILSSQEETYQLGAKTGAFAIDADEAIVIDVSFSSQPDISGQYSTIELSKGPMLCIGSTLNKEMYKKFVELSESLNIPYQSEICSGLTGTNADSITVCKTGIKTALVSIPEKNMHTQAEIVDLGDIENTALLISEYILQGGAFNE